MQDTYCTGSFLSSALKGALAIAVLQVGGKVAVVTILYKVQEEISNI
jgi:hypothetical protein